MESSAILENVNENNVPFLIVMCHRLIPSSKIKCLLLAFLLAVMMGSILLVRNPVYSLKKNFWLTEKSRNNLLDGCRYVYIDMGTNIGIQIRKLYEPHLYPDAPVLPLFKQVFGTDMNEVCSVGFEANPLHTSYLKEFENYCLQRNWRVKIFTSTAVSITEKNLTFYTEPGNEENNQWGATLELALSTHKGNITVPSIDIVSWFKTTVLGRRIPSEPPVSKIMMKSDIERHDSAVLMSLILSGAYCKIDLIYGEHLLDIFRETILRVQQHWNSCKTRIIAMDDESYHNRRFPFTTHMLANGTMVV